MIKKAMLLGAALALASTPAWGLPGGEHSNHSHSGTAPNYGSNPGSSHRSKSGSEHAGGADRQGNGPNDKGNGNGQDKDKSPSDHGNGSDKGKGPGDHGNKGNGHKPHRCLPHEVGYVVSGTLVSDTLTEGPNNTGSGEVVVEVLHGNRHARAAVGTKVAYTLTNAHLTLAVPDADNDSTVGVDDLQAGDRVHLIGRVSELSKRCPAGEFTPQTTIRHAVFHAPRPAGTSSK
jgi:hypothetical protein